MATITAIILTLNEENNIESCLSYLNWTDRNLIVDSGSSDKTIEIARKLGCDIYSNSWEGFAAQRNWALEHTEITTEWVLFVDADEEITPALQTEIRKTLETTTNNALYLCSKIMLFGKWVKRSANFPVWHPRILRYGEANFKNAVTGHGETWEVQGNTGYLQEPYTHYAFSKGLGFWFEKHNRLSGIESEAYKRNQCTSARKMNSLFSKDKHKKRQALRALSYKLPFRPFIRFFYNLLIKGGILDGPAGWTYCSLYLAYEIMISAKIQEFRQS